MQKRPENENGEDREEEEILDDFNDHTYQYEEEEESNDEKTGLYATRSKRDRNEAGFDSIYQLETIMGTIQSLIEKKKE